MTPPARDARHGTDAGPRFARIAQALRFLVVGGASTVATIAVFNLLVHVGERPVLGRYPLTAYVVGIVAGMVVAFVGNLWWVFGRGDGGWVRQLVVFVVVNVVCLGVPLLCLAVSRYVLGADSATADNVSANVVGLVLATALRYVLYRFVVFSSSRSLS